MTDRVTVPLDVARSLERPLYQDDFAPELTKGQLDAERAFAKVMVGDVE